MRHPRPAGIGIHHGLIPRDTLRHQQLNHSLSFHDIRFLSSRWDGASEIWVCAEHSCCTGASGSSDKPEPRREDQRIDLAYHGHPSAVTTFFSVGTKEVVSHLRQTIAVKPRSTRIVTDLEFLCARPNKTTVLTILAAAHRYVFHDFFRGGKALPRNTGGDHHSSKHRSSQARRCERRIS